MHTRYTVYKIGLNGSRNVCTRLCQILERLKMSQVVVFSKDIYFLFLNCIYTGIYSVQKNIIFVFVNTPKIGSKVFVKGQKLFAAAQSRGVRQRH